MWGATVCGGLDFWGASVCGGLLAILDFGGLVCLSRFSTGTLQGNVNATSYESGGHVTDDILGLLSNLTSDK